MTCSRLALLCLPCLVLNASGPEVREEILVVVNNHIITRRVFQQAVEQGSAALYREFNGAELDAKLGNARKVTLQGLIDSYVLGDKAADLGVVISDDNVRTFVDGIKAQNNFTSDGDLERALKGSLGIGLQEYLVRTKQEMIKQEVLRREVFSKIAVDEPELLAYYQEHLADYRQPIRFRVKELVLPKGADDQEKADTQAKLATIRQELAKGTPFDELVKTYSTAPSRSTGGDLGWLSKGVLRMDLEETVLALKPGEISAPVETDKDIYVVQLMEAELDNTKPFAEVRASILEKLQEPRAQSAIESYIQSLRIRANIRYLVPEATILKG